MSQNTTTVYNDGFNHDFTDEDVQRLISIASSPELSSHTCRWVQGNIRCDAAVQGRYFAAHLRVSHGIYNVGQDTSRFVCRWEGCADNSLMSRDALMRHVQERHLPWRWHCPNCGMAFMHKMFRDAHYASCVRAINHPDD